MFGDSFVFVSVDYACLVKVADNAVSLKLSAIFKAIDAPSDDNVALFSSPSNAPNADICATFPETVYVNVISLPLLNVPFPLPSNVNIKSLYFQVPANASRVSSACLVKVFEN